VLLLAIGKATRLFDLLSGKRKIYRAMIVFGKSTDTLDSYGKITDEGGRIPSEKEIEEVIKTFIGVYEQVPPDYSAVNINGRKAYDLAREGEKISLKPKAVTVNDIKLLRYVNNKCMLDIDCMGGTYIRSLVRDIADKLNTKAYMGLLIRTMCDGFKVGESVTIDEFKENPVIIPTEKILEDYPRYDIIPLLKDKLVNGVQISPENMPEGKFRLYLNGELLGMAHKEGK
jgi:tRNA pseudouridine55 synthase